MKNPMRETRARLGWTRERMAVELDCSADTIGRHERDPKKTNRVWMLALLQLESEQT